MGLCMVYSLPVLCSPWTILLWILLYGDGCKAVFYFV
jgi:hypothetical protein